MGIPQFRSEGTDQNGTATSVTPSFAGFTFQANDIIEIVFVTDGTIPTLSTANGFAVAQDPAGNSASISTSGGTVGTAETSVTVFWKRATGTADSPPVIATNSATNWCVQPNSFSGARTTGTPYHAITSAILTTASANVTSVAASSTLANCLFMPRVSSAEDDQAFNSWTMTGSAGPSGTGAPNTGWHSGNANACAFTGDEGGFAAATSGVTATTTFATSTKQAKVTLVLASVAEAFGPDETGPQPQSPPQNWPQLSTMRVEDELPATTTSMVDEDAGHAAVGSIQRAPAAAMLVDDELPQAVGGASTIDDDAPPFAVPAAPPASRLISAPADDDLPITSTAIDEDPIRWMAPAATQAVPPILALSDDLVPAVAASPIVDEDGTQPFQPRSPAFLPAPYFLVEEFAPQIALALGVTAWREKANTTSPNTGTVTTLASYPAWPASTNEQMVTDPRVTNAGNVYELATSGTTASSGGPTTTPAPVTNGAITDNGAKWNYLVTGTGAVDTQAIGSLFLVSTGQGNDAASGTTPTDNKGNSYSKIGTTSFFAGFPQSSAASFVAALPSTGGTGHTISGTYGLGLDGGGDEKSLMFVEVIGGTTIVDHSQGEFSPNGSNVVTSSSVTTTGPAILVCFCWLNGGVQPDGFLHTVTPGSGFALLPLASGLLEIGNTAGQVQGGTIWKAVATPGTYTASITTAPVSGTPEGAVMHLIAVQGVSAPTIGVDEDVRMAPWPVLRIWAPQPVMLQDDLAALGVAEGDEPPRMWSPVAWPAPAPRWDFSDELAVLTGVDEDTVPPPVIVPAAAPAVVHADADDLPGLGIEEDGATAGAFAPTAPSAILTRVDADELAAVAALLVEDDAPAVSSTLPQLPIPVARADIDELPTAAAGAAILDEDAPRPIFQPTASPVLARVDADDQIPAVVVSMVDDDVAAIATAMPPRMPVMQPAPVDDELAQFAADDSVWTFAVTWPAPPPPPRSLQVDDELAVTPLVDDEPPRPPAVLMPPWRFAVSWPDDELPTPVVLPPMIDEDGIVLPWRQLPAWIVSLASDDDLPLIALVSVPTPPIRDNVFIVRARASGYSVRARRP